MSRRPRRNHTPAFKAKVALAADQGRSDTGSAGGAVRRSPQPDHDVESAAGGRGCRRVRSWRRHRSRRTPAVDVKSLHAKIGELTLENDFLEGALTKAGLLSAKR